MPTCCRAPRSSMSMNGSPAIWSEKRVHRAQSTQRSRSRSICDEIGIGFSNVRLRSTNRESGRPWLIAWFCSGHSPPLSQIGQSSGWLMSSSSMTPCCALSATGELSWVLTTIPSVTVVVHDASGLRCPSTSTRHCRQAPTGSSSGWSQKRGISIPSSSAARITRVPFGTAMSTPSIVHDTRSGAGAGRFSAVFCSVIARAPGPCCRFGWRLGSWRLGGGRARCVRGQAFGSLLCRRCKECRRGGVEGAAAPVQVCEVLVAEVLDGRRDRRDRTVTQGTERAPEDVVGDIQQLVELVGLALAALEPVEDLDQPVGPLATGRAFAAGLVGVELGPSQHGTDDARRVVEDLQGPGA